MRSILSFSFILATLFAAAQPEKQVKTQIDSMVSYIRNKATESFAQNTVYQGEDIKRKWKDVYDPGNAAELKNAKAVMERLKNVMADCNYREFAGFKQDKQHEGEWYVYTYACGSTKKIHLAFLGIKGKYALGDIDVEEEADD